MDVSPVPGISYVKDVNGHIGTTRLASGWDWDFLFGITAIITHQDGSVFHGTGQVVTGRDC